MLQTTEEILEKAELIESEDKSAKEAVYILLKELFINEKTEP